MPSLGFPKLTNVFTVARVYNRGGYLTSLATHNFLVIGIPRSSSTVPLAPERLASLASSPKQVIVLLAIKVFCFLRSLYLDALVLYQTQLCCVLADFSQEEWKRMSSKYLLHGKCTDASEGGVFSASGGVFAKGTALFDRIRVVLSI